MKKIVEINKKSATARRGGGVVSDANRGSATFSRSDRSLSERCQTLRKVGGDGAFEHRLRIRGVAGRTVTTPTVALSGSSHVELETDDVDPCCNGGDAERLVISQFVTEHFDRLIDDAVVA